MNFEKYSPDMKDLESRLEPVEYLPGSRHTDGKA